MVGDAYFVAHFLSPCILVYTETCQFGEFAGVEEVEWEGGDEVEDEPSAQVLLGDLPRARHHLPLLVHERRAEVQDYVCNILDLD